MLHQPKMYVLLALVLHLLLVLGCDEEQEKFSLAGHWEGLIKVSTDSSEITQDAHVSLIISSDSDVLGEIGNASIEQGATLEINNFEENDYVINGRLTGSLFGIDSLKEAPVRILIQLKEEKLVGGFSLKTRTDGTLESVTLKGTDMILKRL
jgi:hypothetical protein